MYTSVTSIMLVYSIHLWYWTSMFWSIDTCQNKVSADQYHMSISRAQAWSSARSAVFLKLTADPILVFDWIAGSTQVNSHKHFSRAFCGLTRLHGHTTSTIVLTQSTLFVLRWKKVWKMFLSAFFAGFNPVWHIISVVHSQWWLCSYSSQASEGYKLKAECLFLICLELLFSLYCNFWHIFRSSDKVTWCLEDLSLEQ